MTLAALKPEAPDPLAALRDNAAAVEVPWPSWVWWCIGLGSVLVVAGLVWLARWWARRQPKVTPPTPRQIALRALEDLKATASRAEPYEFSVLVSDVLRTYVSGHFGLLATQQTSPEFLHAIGASPQFTTEDRQLLAAFLGRCDLLKFARVGARSEENPELLGSAAAFVQGGRA